MSLTRTVFLYCGFLMLTLAHAANGHAICDIRLIIPKHFYTSGSAMTEGNGNINNRSLSAWKWIPHASGHRIPSVIFEAQCESHRCTYPNSHQELSLNSVPIYSNRLVLTQDPKNRKCFTLKFQTVIVGCTCVWEEIITVTRALHGP